MGTARLPPSACRLPQTLGAPAPRLLSVVSTSASAPLASPGPQVPNSCPHGGVERWRVCVNTHHGGAKHFNFGFLRHNLVILPTAAFARSLWHSGLQKTVLKDEGDSPLAPCPAPVPHPRWRSQGQARSQPHVSRTALCSFSHTHTHTLTRRKKEPEPTRVSGEEI